MITTRNRKIHTELKWLIFVLPALMFYMIIFILPAISTVYFSFTDWDGVTSHFIGLDNFIEMTKDSMILTTIGNTAMYSIFITIIQNLLGIALAVFMVKKLSGVNFMRTMFFMPYIFSSLLIGYVWGFILEPNIGVVNNLLNAMHLGFLKANWLGNPEWGRWMIILITIWQCVGYSMVIYIAGLQAIPAEMYESSDIDGAKAFAKFKNITFPLIAPSFTVNIMLSVIGCLQLFNQIYALTNGGPGYATNSIATMIYNLGFGTGSRWGYGTALSVTLFAFILIITTILIPLLRKREVEM
jgi:raffinose/stachyose/melibiose transport system permease protein